MPTPSPRMRVHQDLTITAVDQRRDRVVVGIREPSGVRRRISFWFEDYAPKHMLEEIGFDKVMFETDYPHPTSLYPGVQDKLVKTLGGYDYATRKQVLEDNAVKLYNLEFD